MTLTSSTVKITHTGDSSTTAIPITFVFYEDSDIRVVQRVTSTGVETLKTKGTHYTLTGGGTGGLTGELTTTAGNTVPTGETLTIKSNRDDLQGVDIISGGIFPSISVEEGLDKNVRLVQQRSEEIDRSIKLAETSPTDGSTITFPEPEASKIIGWNSAGDDLANTSVGDISVAIDVVESGTASGDMFRNDGSNWVNRTAAETRADLRVGEKGSDLASPSGGTLTLGSDGIYFDITGTNAITAINGTAGQYFTLQFDGALVFTDGASLTLPGNLNITTATGDIAFGYMLTTTAAIILSYTKTSGNAVIETVTTPDSSNLIINGDFRVAQRGTSFTSATTPANDDDAYLLDRWIILSDGNDAVDVTQQTDALVGNYSYIRLDVETINKKFGIFQVIEQKNLVSVLSGSDVVSLSFRARVADAGKLATIKAGVVSWDSTADTVTSDIVGTWNAQGTTPTLATNWTFENTPADLSLTTSDATYQIENIAINTSSVKNIGVFIWSDDVANSDTADGTVFLEISEVNLVEGATAQTFAARSYGEELELCKRYFDKWITSGTTGEPVGAGMNTGTIEAYIHFPYSEKRVNPTITEGTVSHFRVASAAGSDAVSSWSSDTSGIRGVRLRPQVASGLGLGDGSILEITDAAAFIDIDAEL